MSILGEKLLWMVSPKNAADAFNDASLSLPLDVETVKSWAMIKQCPEKFKEGVNLDAYAAQIPGFHNYIYGKRVLDFGCGGGAHSIALAKSGAAMVLGLDNASRVETGRLSITLIWPSLVRPVWRAQLFFLKIPWANILFSERTIMNVRRKYIREDKRHYRGIHLNKMSVKKFESILKHSELKSIHSKYNCVSNLNFISHIPLVRELFIIRKVVFFRTRNANSYLRI